MKPGYKIEYRGLTMSNIDKIYVFNWHYSNTIDMLSWNTSDFNEATSSKYLLAIWKIKLKQPMPAQ